MVFGTRLPCEYHPSTLDPHLKPVPTFYPKTSVTTKLTEIPKFPRSLTATRPYFINNFKYMEKQNSKNIQ